MTLDAQPDGAGDRAGGAAPASAPKPPARLRARLAAGAIDLVIVAAAMTPVSQPFPPVLPIAVFVVYHTVLTWWDRRSIGKALLGLRVERSRGHVSLWWALTRSGPGYLLLGLFGLGLLFAAIDARQRALYDLVLGGTVIQETDSKQRPRGLLDRLTEYAESHKETVAERTKKRAALVALWGWTAGIGSALHKALQWLRGQTAVSESSPSILGVASGKAAAVAAAALATVGSAVVIVVPPAGGLGNWLLTDRYWIGGIPSDEATPVGDAPPLEGSQAAIERWMDEQGQEYVGTCPVTRRDEAAAWCTTKPEQVTRDQDPDLRDFGVAQGEVHGLASTDSFHYFGALLLVEGSQGWRVAAIQLSLGDLGDESFTFSRWIPADVGIEGAYDEVHGNN